MKRPNAPFITSLAMVWNGVVSPTAAAKYGKDFRDHDQLRRDPVMATLVGKLEARRSGCAPLAGKSMLNRLELSVFLESLRRAPRQIILDLDTTDDRWARASRRSVLPWLYVATGVYRSTSFANAFACHQRRQAHQGGHQRVTEQHTQPSGHFLASRRAWTASARFRTFRW